MIRVNVFKVEIHTRHDWEVIEDRLRDLEIEFVRECTLQAFLDDSRSWIIRIRYGDEWRTFFKGQDIPIDHPKTIKGRAYRGEFKSICQQIVAINSDGT